MKTRGFFPKKKSQSFIHQVLDSDSIAKGYSKGENAKSQSFIHQVLDSDPNLERWLLLRRKGKMSQSFIHQVLDSDETVPRRESGVV